MDIKDFENIKKYKYILPTVTILGIIACFTGPFFYTYQYGVFCYIVNIFGLYKSFSTLVSALITIGIHRSIIAKISNPKVQTQEEKAFLVPENPLMYGFVIPNYKEQIYVLQATLDTLAAHPRAKQNYCIFLGMQIHQQGSNLKADKLLQKYNSQFKLIHANFHTIKQFQQKGKSSNVSSVVENAEPVLKQHNIDVQNLFFTIIDADSLIPALYIDLVEKDILTKYDQRYKKIFIPPQIFNINEDESSLIVRVMDNFHAFSQIGMLHNIYGVCMPLSNYTLSYDLIKRMGYWDTCADAIGQDYHTAQKAFWKSDGDIITQPIYACANQMNITTGNGFFADAKARLQQCQRHCEGCATFAYSINQFLKNKKTWKRCRLMLFLLDLYFTGAVFPWVTISIFLQNVFKHFIYIPPMPFHLEVYALLTLLFSIAPLIFFYYFKRSSMTHIHKKPPQSKWSSILEMKIFLLVISVVIFLPSFVIAAFKVLGQDRQYVVAQKKIRH